MSALILKSANHLYKIFKVYVAMALCGALGVVIIAVILAKPLTLLVAIGSLAFVMAIAVPASEREVVIADLREQFGNLEKKYGRVSASAWYVIQITLFFFNLSSIGKFRAKLERVFFQFALFIVCIVAITELIESTNVIQFLLRLLR